MALLDCRAALRIVSAFAITLSAVAVSAQSDGSLEDAYAQQCPNQEDNQVCRTLRREIEAAASTADVPAVWGNLAALASTSWGTADFMISYRWVRRGEVMEVEFADADGTYTYTDRLDLNAEGTRISSSATLPNGNKLAMDVSNPRPGVVIYTSADAAGRTVHRFAGDRMYARVERFAGGQWTAPGAEAELKKLTAADAKALSERLIVLRGMRFQAASKKAAELEQVWGPVAGREGAWWRGPSAIWLIERARDQKRDFFGKISEGAEAYRISMYRRNGTSLWRTFHIVRDERAGELRFSRLDDSGRAPRLPDGGVFLDHLDHALVGKGRDAFELVAGRMSGGSFIPGEASKSERWLSGRYERLGEADTIAFNALVAQREKERVTAEAQRKAQGGDGGLFGALMAGAGAAMAGGSAEQVLGAASQGAQMADPGGATASALGQVAGAVGAPQIDFQSALTGSATGGGVGGAGGSYPTKPNLALGSCPGFTEGNYRTVALEPGNDVQRKTMCGQAFEYYTMYKRAIAQGYSEADANRTYAAHEGAVANLQSFVGN